MRWEIQRVIELPFVVVIVAVGLCWAASVEGLSVGILPDNHPLFGEEITIKADIGTLPGVVTVVAGIDTNGVPVDINGGSDGDTLHLHLSSGTRYEGTTVGLNALSRPMPLHLRVSALDLNGVPIEVGEHDFETTNLRIQGSGFKQIFAPGDSVGFEAKVLGTKTGIAVDVKDIYGSGSPVTPVSLAEDAARSSVFLGGFRTPADPKDFLVMLFKDRSSPGTPVPIDGIIPQFTTDPIKVSIDTVSGSVNEEVVVPVNIGKVENPDPADDNVSNKRILGTSFEIGFDNTKLTFMGLSLGFDGVLGSPPPTGAGHTVSFHVEGGLVKVSSAGTDTIPHKGLLFLLRFEVLGSVQPDEHLPIEFHRAELEAKVNPTDPDDPGHILFASPQVPGGVMVTPEFPLGDVNHSHLVTSLDAVLILKKLVGLVLPPSPSSGEPSFDPELADVNADGRVSALDAALIFQFDAGIIEHFPGAPKLVPVPGERLVALSETRMSGDHLIVPVTLSDRSGVLAGEMSLHYDPSGVEVVGVSPSGQVTGLNVQSRAQDGRLRVAFAGAEAGVGAGDILMVELRPLNGLGIIESPLTITGIVLNDGMIRTTVQSSLPKVYTLSQNSPNPFNPETQIAFDLPEAGHVTLVIYNLTGQVIRTLVAEERVAGRYTVTWNGKNEQGQAVASGVYVYRLTVGDFTATKKMVLMK
jgi:hypothetical protein